MPKYIKIKVLTTYEYCYRCLEKCSQGLVFDFYRVNNEEGGDIYLLTLNTFTAVANCINSIWKLYLNLYSRK